MTVIRRSVVFAVVICSCMVSAAQLRAQEWASAGALGDVFVGTRNGEGKPLINVFGHVCSSTPPTPGECVPVRVLKEQFTVGSDTGTITGFAFDTTPKENGQSRYDLYVAIDTGDIGKIWRVKETLVGGSHPVEPVPLNTPSADIWQIKFDEDRNLYVSYGGLSPKIEKREPPYSSASVTHLVTCDVTLPAPGLWFDLSARTLATPANPPNPEIKAKQFAVYACGGTQVRWVDVLSTPPAPPVKTEFGSFPTLPNLPGNLETARDLVLLAPIKEEPLTSNSQLDTIFGAQGGLVIAYGTNLEWLNRFGVVKRGFDFGSGSADVNTWSSVTVSPTGGSVWGAAADTSFLTRFRLTTGSSPQPPEPRFDTSSVPVSALIVNGVPNLASAMQSITVNGPAATYLKGTRWEHSIKFEALFADGPNEGLPNPAYSSVRMAVTAFEGQTAPPTVLSYPLFTDLKLDGRLLTNFSGARAFKTSRGRGNYYRMIQQWLEDPSCATLSPPASCVSQVDMSVTISYIHEEFTQSVPFLTGLFDDVNHQPRGFLTDSGQVDQFDKNIRDEWFKTDSTARGSTRTSNDYMIGVQTGSRATLDSFKTSVNLGSSLPIRATYPFAVNATFCAGLVLTAARDGSPVIVGSSLTTLNHLGEGIPYFSPAGSTAPNTCRANLDVEPNSAEDPSLPDFAKGFSYNLCVVFKDLESWPLAGLPANTPPPADVCKTTLVK